MITVRSALALVVALALVACQSGGVASTTKKDAMDDAIASVEMEMEHYKPTPAFKTKVKDLMVSMTDRLLTACMDASSEANMEACFHERTLAGFDQDGTLRRQCKLREDLGEDFKCIFFGSMGDDLRARLTNDAVSPYNWSKPEVSTHLIFRQLMLEQWRGCMGTGSASDPFDCFIARTTTTLDLSSSDLDPCLPYKDDDETFGSCVGESYTYKYLKAGVARM